MLESIVEFKKLLAKKNKESIPVQTIWGVVHSVNENDKTMDVMVNGIEYFDVLLGLGAIVTIPKKGSRCLIGIIENKHGGFLIDASEIQRQTITIDTTSIEITKEGVKIERNGLNLKTVQTDFMTAVSGIMVPTVAGLTPIDPQSKLKIEKSISQISQILI